MSALINEFKKTFQCSIETSPNRYSNKTRTSCFHFLSSFITIPVGVAALSSSLFIMSSSASTTISKSTPRGVVVASSLAFVVPPSSSTSALLRQSKPPLFPPHDSSSTKKLSLFNENENNNTADDPILFEEPSTVDVQGTAATTNYALDLEALNTIIGDPTTVIPSSTSTSKSTSSSAAITDLLQTKSFRTTLNLPTPINGLFSHSTSSLSFPQQHQQHPKIIGHRGTIHHELENTRQGFIRAVDEMGCDGIELDVFMLPCGTLIVFHGGGTDENPGDLTDYCLNFPKNSILDYTYEETKQLQFNPNFQEFVCGYERTTSKEDAYIPTLREVLLDMKARPDKIVKIELKGPDTAVPVLKLVEELDMVSQCHYSSFDHSQIHTIRKLRPQRLPNNGSHVYKTGALFNTVPSNFVELAKKVDASEVHLRYDTCTPQRIAQIHQASMESMAWSRGPIGMMQDTTTVYHDIGYEDSHFLSAMIETGVKQLCVNKPDILSNLLRTK